MNAEEKKLLQLKQNFYVVELKNVGGLVMPIILQLNYEDGKKDEIRIPAEIWRRNSERVSKLIITEKAVQSLTLDPL